jgi:hypothetical protein
MLNLFLPLRISDTILLNTTILYIFINGKYVSATLVLLSGTKRTILKTQSIELNMIDAQKIEVIIGQHIAQLITGWKFDYTICIIPAHDVMYKIMEFPFDDLEKIKMVMPFEIEAHLPVALSECSIDAIIIEKKRIDKKNITAKTLIVIIKQTTITFYREVFKHANILLNSITIDSIEIIIDQQKRNMSGNAIIFSANRESINCLLYINNILNSIRLVHEFTEKFDYISELSEKESSEEKKTHDLSEQKESVEKKEPEKHTELIEFDSHSALEEAINAHNNDTMEINSAPLLSQKNTNIDNKIIGFLSLILKQHNLNKENTTLYTLGINSNVSYLESIKNTFGITAKEYNTLESKNKKISIIFKENSFHDILQKPESEINLLCARASQESIEFNLAQEEKSLYAKNNIKKQLITSLIITGLLIIGFLTWNFIKINTYNKSINTMEIEAINFLKREFNLTPRHTGTLERALKECEQTVTYNQNTLPPLIVDSKYQFLHIFNIISNDVDKDSIKGLEISEIKWKNNVNGVTNQLFLQGHVSDFNSLHVFEKKLQQSNLFSIIPPVQNTKFSLTLLTHKMKDVDL